MAEGGKPRLRILLGSEIAIGPGKADLLEAIQETGSISAAGRKLNMSYRRAWLLVRHDEPVVRIETERLSADTGYSHAFDLVAMTDDARLVELEIRFMQQQELLHELSDVLYAQQRTMDALRAEVELLKKKLEADPGLVDARQHERPPHY